MPLLTLENYQNFEHIVQVNNVTLKFFVFNGNSVQQAMPKMQRAVEILSRMPSQHLRVVFPIIFIAGCLPSTGHGGGTPAGTAVHTLINRREDEIGATADAMTNLMVRCGNPMSFHWIPPHVYRDNDRIAYTISHEAIHAIDMTLGLHICRRVPPDLARTIGVSPNPQPRPFTSDDLPTNLPGQACHAGSQAVQISVNAYLSLITGMRGLTPARKRRLISGLRLSRAFESIPENWWMSYNI